MWQKYSKWIMPILIPIWVGVSFFTSQMIVLALAWLLLFLKISLASIDTTLINTIETFLIYIITLALVIGLPWLINKSQTTPSEIGLDRLPKWIEIFITPAGLIIYFILSAILIAIASNFIPGFNIDQVQDIPFSNLSQQYEYLLAFVSLVVLVPFAEEILFRGYLFGKLKKYIPVWVAVILTSVIFGILHNNLNVAIDVFALSIVLCVMRQITGSIWPSILLHMAKNGIAFYFLFIYK